MDMHALALTLHVVGFIVWLGNLYAIAVTLVARDASPEEAIKKRLGDLARTHGLTADIGATLAIASGLWLIAGAPTFYLHQPWLHMKLTLVALGILGLHGFLRVK